MNGKEFLESCTWADKRAARLLRMKRVLEDRMLNITQNVKTVDVMSSSEIHDRQAEYMTESVDIGMELASLAGEYQKQTKRMLDVLEQVRSDRVHAVMCMRYVEHMGFQAIADELEMDIRNVFHLHGKGLKIIEQIIEKENDNGQLKGVSKGTAERRRSNRGGRTDNGNSTRRSKRTNRESSDGDDARSERLEGVGDCEGTQP